MTHNQWLTFYALVYNYQAHDNSISIETYDMLLTDDKMLQCVEIKVFCYRTKL